METEIKKVNNLDEIKNLNVGDKIKTSDFDGLVRNLVFDFIKENKINFIEEKLGLDETIFGRTYNGNKMKFWKGVMSTTSYNRKAYLKEDNEYESKLKILQGEKQNVTRCSC